MAMKFDLVVVGSGAGGLVTAIQAHDLGMRTVVVEAASKVGGATAFSGGQVWVGANHVMERIGVPHKTDSIHWATVSGAAAVPAPGLFGGYPAATNKFQLIRDAKVAEQINRTGRMPADVAEIENGRSEWVEAKSFDRHPTPDLPAPNVAQAADVWVTAWAGGAGYGDPIERDPAAVLTDIRAGRTSADWARRAYGVVLDDTGLVDDEATSALRRDVRQQRLSEARPWDSDAGEEAASGRPRDIEPAAQRRVTCPGRPDLRRGPSTRPGRRELQLHALIRDLPLTEANPHIRDPAIHTDHDVAFRQIICPHTGRLLQAELTVDGAPPQWDVRPAGR